MRHFMCAATRKHDQFTSLQFLSFGARMAYEGTSFRYEMEHHSIARFHRIPLWACHTRAHQYQAVSANGF